jgi:catechol 2,3-dioxygenase-like lactoylglutathione lyase family enzyme
MPLGDPHGGLFEYTVEGLPESIFALRIPVSDAEKSAEFYRDVLGMRILGSKGGRTYLCRGECRIILEISGSTGIDTGAYLAVDSPYNAHRRLIDEGVEFVEDPVRTPFGVETSFFDPDRNIIHVMDAGSDFRL